MDMASPLCCHRPASNFHRCRNSLRFLLCGRCRTFARSSWLLPADRRARPALARLPCPFIAFPERVPPGEPNDPETRQRRPACQRVKHSRVRYRLPRPCRRAQPPRPAAVDRHRPRRGRCRSAAGLRAERAGRFRDGAGDGRTRFLRRARPRSGRPVLRSDPPPGRSAGRPFALPEHVAERRPAGRSLAGVLDGPHHRDDRCHPGRRHQLPVPGRTERPRPPALPRRGAALADPHRDPLAVRLRGRRRGVDPDVPVPRRTRRSAPPVDAAVVHRRGRAQPGRQGARRRAVLRHLRRVGLRQLRHEDPVVAGTAVRLGRHDGDRPVLHSGQPRSAQGERRHGVLGHRRVERHQPLRAELADRLGHHGARRRPGRQGADRLRRHPSAARHQRRLAGLRLPIRPRQRPRLHQRAAVGRPRPRPRRQLPRRAVAAAVEVVLVELAGHGRLLPLRRGRGTEAHRNPGPQGAEGGDGRGRRQVRRAVRPGAAAGVRGHRTGQPQRQALGVPEGDLLRRQRLDHRRDLSGDAGLPLPGPAVPRSAPGAALRLRGERRLAEEVRGARPRLQLPQRDRTQRRQRGGHAGRGVRQHAADDGRLPGAQQLRHGPRVRVRALHDPQAVGRLPGGQHARPGLPEPDRRLHRLHRAQRQPRPEGHPGPRRHGEDRDRGRQLLGRRPLRRHRPGLHRPVGGQGPGPRPGPPQAGLRPAGYLEPEVQRLPRCAAGAEPRTARGGSEGGRLVLVAGQPVRHPPGCAAQLHQGRLGDVDGRVAARPPGQRPAGLPALPVRERLPFACAVHRLVRHHGEHSERLPGPPGGRWRLRPAEPALVTGLREPCRRWPAIAGRKIGSHATEHPTCVRHRANAAFTRIRLPDRDTERSGDPSTRPGVE
ncbi:hypothetical protein SGPA1_40220 [Streptomyces misionensis JCM 4497]